MNSNYTDSVKDIVNHTEQFVSDTLKTSVRGMLSLIVFGGSDVLLL